ncbi:MAG: hypothetical protein AB8I08_27875 [Sandaracinaceae bacterium]
MTRLLVLFVWLVAAPVCAQTVPDADVSAEAVAAPPDPLDLSLPEQVRFHLEAGDFVQAGAALDRAMQAESLTVPQLAELFAYRALLAYADEQFGQLEEALVALANLTDDRWSLAGFPPPLRRRLVEIRAGLTPIGMSLEVPTEVRDGVRFGRTVANVEHDPSRVVRRVRVFAGVAEGALRLLEPDDELSVGDPHRAVTLRYRLVGLGLGGAEVALSGTASEPLRMEFPALPIDDTFLHVAVATLVAVMVAGAVSVGVAYAATDGFTEGENTRVGPIRCCD